MTKITLDVEIRFEDTVDVEAVGMQDTIMNRVAAAVSQSLPDSNKVTVRLQRETQTVTAKDVGVLDQAVRAETVQNFSTKLAKNHTKLKSRAAGVLDDGDMLHLMHHDD